MSDSSIERPDLASLLAYWQPVMRLADWDITARYERHLGAGGYCHPSHAYKRALIRLIDPTDWPSLRLDYTQDVEADLVHELGHCHLAVFKTDNGSLLGDAEEQIVTSYARALITVKRGRLPIITGCAAQPITATTETT